MTKTIILFSLLLAFSVANAKTENPNIIIIYVDDLGYGDLSCYGATAVLTPNVDKLAEEGVLFNCLTV